MKKHIINLFFALWAIGIYSCAGDPELNNPFAGDDSDVSGNALYFYPSYLEASTASTFTIDIHVQEVTSLVGAEIEFSFDKDLVDFTSASAGSLLAGASENVLIDEINVELGRVLLTLATAQDEGAGLSDAGSLVQLTFTPKSAGVFTLELDLSAETAICPWHGHSDDHSVYIGSSNPNSEQSFSSLINATVIIQ